MTSTSEQSEEIFKRDRLGRVRIPQARREALLDEFERGGSSGAQFASYVGIKYSTFATWIQQRRRLEQLKKSLVPQSENQEERGPASGGWVEAVIEANPERKAPESPLRIYFTAGAYCQIRNAREASLVAELLGRLGTKGC